MGSALGVLDAELSFLEEGELSAGVDEAPSASELDEAWDEASAVAPDSRTELVADSVLLVVLLLSALLEASTCVFAELSVPDEAEEELCVAKR